MEGVCRPSIEELAEVPDFRRWRGAAAPADGGLLRVDGERNIAAALRCFAGQPTAVVALIGIQIENSMTPGPLQSARSGPSISSILTGTPIAAGLAR